jgi:Tfp pilus assembly protein PilX
LTVRFGGAAPARAGADLESGTRRLELDAASTPSAGTRPLRRAPPSLVADERGMALMAAMLVMLLLAIVTVSLMTGIQSETRIAGLSMRSSIALNAAEAGVAEAIGRIRSGDIPDTSNPRMVAQIFLTASGSVPVLGADSIALATAQPAGQWLDYSTTKRGEGALTVAYKTDPARTTIYRYDPTLSPSVQSASGQPIYVIRATGRKGKEERTIETEVSPRPFDVDLRAGLSAGVDVKASGSTVICGYNHRSNTPPGTSKLGRNGLPGSCDWAFAVPLWENGPGVPAVRSTGAISEGGGSQLVGAPPRIAPYDPDFYAGPWETIGMSQASFWEWLGPPESTVPPILEGVHHLDNNQVRQDRMADFHVSAAAGLSEGMLYVDGDLTINGAFVYTGLVYVEGDLKINGHAWVLGAVVVRGRTEVKANGNSTILFSRDAIVQVLSRQSGQFETLSWREIP